MLKARAFHAGANAPVLQSSASLKSLALTGIRELFQTGIAYKGLKQNRYKPFNLQQGFESVAHPGQMSTLTTSKGKYYYLLLLILCRINSKPEFSPTLSFIAQETKLLPSSKLNKTLDTSLTLRAVLITF